MAEIRAITTVASTANFAGIGAPTACAPLLYETTTGDLYALLSPDAVVLVGSIPGGASHTLAGQAFGKHLVPATINVQDASEHLANRVFDRPIDPVIRQASTVYLPTQGTGSGVNSVEDDVTTRGSSGVRDGTLTYLSVGSTAVKVSVAAGEGYLRATNDQQGDLKFVSWPASADLYTFSAPAAETETSIFFGIEMSGGAAVAVASSSFSYFNGYDKFWLGRVTYDGTNMEILNSYAHAEDTANFARSYLRKVFPFIREQAPEGTGGLELATSGTNQMSMTAGNIWHGFNQYQINAIAAGATFDTHYKTAAGFVSSTAVAWDSTNYSTGTALAAMAANRYGTRWIYLDVGKNSVVGSAYNAQLDMVYGTSNATTVAAAQQELAPSVPAHLQYHGRLIGRIIFRNDGSGNATLVESAWTQMFAASAVGDHSLLSNLQGGAAGDYYHLTSAESVLLLDTGLTTELLVGGGASVNPVWTTATGSGAPVRAVSPTITGKLTVSSTAATDTIAINNTHATNAYGVYLNFANMTGDSTRYFYRGDDTGGVKFQINSDGSATFSSLTVSGASALTLDASTHLSIRAFDRAIPGVQAVLGDASDLIAQRVFGPKRLPAMWG